MIKRSFSAIVLFSLLSVSVLPGIAGAYWIWTPETKKFVNPKYAVKDSPKEQFDWAMSFYDAKDFKRAATEFEKLVKQYEFSEYASKAQYYVGLCYENQNKYYIAYQNYQKTIDNFPHIANTDEILAREFAIGNLYFDKPSPKVLGTDIMAPLDRAVEIFKKVVENAPYGRFAEEAQFKLGEALKKSERYEEAIQAFHKIVEDYPKSRFTTQAMYEESQCAYKASLRPAYDAAATDNAIRTFEKFVNNNKDTSLTKQADDTMKRLKDNVAEKTFKAAEFYEAQGKAQAAILYYQDVIDSYPDSSFVVQAQARIEALRKKKPGKIAALKDAIKKKSETVAREKKPWSPLKFEGPKPEKKAEEAVPESPKKKSWNPFRFESPKPEKQSEPAAPKAPKKPWSPLKFERREKSTETEARTTPPIEAPKKPWKPFSFDTAKKTEEPAPQVKEEAIAPAAESPIALSSPQIAEAPQVAEAPKVEPAAQVVEPEAVETPAVEPKAAEPQVTEAPKEEEAVPQVPQAETPERKPWRPLNFETNKETSAQEETRAKGWKPLYFGTNDKPMAATDRRW